MTTTTVEYQRNFHNHIELGDYFYESEYKRLIQEMRITEELIGLEVGCGVGSWMKKMPVKEVYGVDVSENNLSKINEKHIKTFLSPAEKLPFKDDKFDFVFFGSSLHHVENLDKALDEAKRVLKKDGRLLIFEPNRIHPQRKIINIKFKPLRDLLRMTIFKSSLTLQEDHFIPKDVNELLIKHGFKMTKFKYMFPEYNTKSIFAKIQKYYFKLNFIPKKYRYPWFFIESIKN